MGEVYTALQTGLIDAVLIAAHPSMFVPENVNVLEWSDDAIEAVTDTYPYMVETVLPKDTYSGQVYDIHGFAPR